MEIKPEWLEEAELAANAERGAQRIRIVAENNVKIVSGMWVSLDTRDNSDFEGSHFMFEDRTGLDGVMKFRLWPAALKVIQARIAETINA